MPYGSAYYVDGSVTLGIWAYGAWGWQKVTTLDVSVFTQVAGGGQQTVGWTASGTFTLPAGTTHFGANVDGHTGVSAAVADLIAVRWSASSQAGTRPATDPGQKTTVTVRPQ